MMKDAGLRIRIEKELREMFLQTCRQQDRPAAQVLRKFMLEHIDDHDNVLNDLDKRRVGG